jgi:hypothetical protein
LVQERLRSDELKKVALSGVLQNGITLISQVILSGARYGGWALMLGYVIGRLASILKLQTSSFENEKSEYSFAQIQKYKLKTLLRPVRKIFPTAIFDGINQAIPILFIGLMFGSKSAGVIGLLQNALLVPVTLVGSMIFSTLYSRSAIAQELGFVKMKGSFRNQFGQQFFKMIILFLAASILFVGFILPRILSDRWIIDYRLVVIMSAAFALQLQTYPTIGILNVLAKFSIPRTFAALKSSASILICILFTFIKIGAVEFAIIFYLIHLLANAGFLLFAHIKLQRD